MNDNDELGGLIDNDVPHTVIGHVCTDECDTTCFTLPSRYVSL